MMPAGRKIVQTLLIACLAAPFLLAAGFCYFLYVVHTYKLPMPEGVLLEEPTVAVVFTGAPDRIPHALDLQKHGHIKEVFISGVNKSVAARDFVAAHHLTEDTSQDITLGQNAENTLENVQETKSWLVKQGVRSFYLVTSDYHMPRSLWLLKRSLPSEIKIIPLPARSSKPIETLDEWLRQARIVIIEYGKILKTPFQLLFFACTG